MSDDDQLIPLKRVLGELGISRATLWRVRNSDVEGMPKPKLRRGRLFWKQSDIAKIDDALDAFSGRGGFERARSADRQRAEQRYSRLVELRDTTRRKRRKASSGNPSVGPDLFVREEV